MSFSSWGGMEINGLDRLKPDISAPNGVNTTVTLSSNPDNDIEGDGYPNFFGTSAAAPHAAAVAALIKQGKSDFYGENIGPVSIRNLLKSTAIDMYEEDYDAKSGAGFIQADSALKSFANPKPELNCYKQFCCFI